MSINRKIITKNAYRITKERGKTALRVRVPGGHLPVRHFETIKLIADKYGNGSVHITTRQGFEIPDIDFKYIPEINKIIRPVLEDLELSIGVDIVELHKGYPAAGTRNIAACIGNRVCPFANYDTTDMAISIEKEVFPNHYHVKIACTGCPNDCIKAHSQDFGIIGMTEPQYDESRCISCQACVKNCKKKVTEALTFKNYSVVRDEKRCIGCGECAMKCPVGAMTRSSKKYFSVVIMGRTGKKNPRLAMPFMKWAEKDVVIQVIKNTYPFIDKYIDKSLVKEHVGYIVDRVGYKKFKDIVLDGIEFNDELEVAESINFGGYWYERNNCFEKPV
ncbi:MAG: sulfite reductase subunit C [Lentisphaerae bacterium]|nr:sulfite reductase subunit C [Lentisphaerota bacterium]MCP4102436.1 sulfite reductase subunit C [Lentisphaerota bacterium]